jgi:threonine aldolase
MNGDNTNVPGGDKISFPDGEKISFPGGEKISFASENFCGAHDLIMNALIDANTGNMPSYGKDPFTADTVALFRDVFGDDIEVYFTFNGTGANNFGLGAVTKRHHSIFCSDVAHLYVDESTAPETFIGCRLYPVNSKSGKIVPDDLKSRLGRVGDLHHPQPGVVSLTQPTEYGTVYSIGELKAIKAVCTENNMLLHVDGARFFQAAEHLHVSLKELSRDVGVDILTLGGTKAGLLFGEAVIFFNARVGDGFRGAGDGFRFDLKRSMQLASKNRFIAVQFQRLLQGELWREIAGHTNELARYFAGEIEGILELAHPVESNAVFVRMPRSLHGKMQEVASFYWWNEERSEARFIFSFNNTKEEIGRFVERLRPLYAG